MSELTLTVIRLGLVALLWVFVFSVVGVLRSDLYGTRVLTRGKQKPAPRRARERGAPFAGPARCRLLLPTGQDPGAIEVAAQNPDDAVDERAVGRAEVADAGHQVRAISCHANLGVPPRDSRVVENDVGRVVASQD